MLSSGGLFAVLRSGEMTGVNERTGVNGEKCRRNEVSKWRGIARNAGGVRGWNAGNEWRQRALLRVGEKNVRVLIILKKLKKWVPWGGRLLHDWGKCLNLPRIF